MVLSVFPHASAAAVAADIAHTHSAAATSVNFLEGRGVWAVHGTGGVVMGEEVVMEQSTTQEGGGDGDGDGADDEDDEDDADGKDDSKRTRGRCETVTSAHNVRPPVKRWNRGIGVERLQPCACACFCLTPPRLLLLPLPSPLPSTLEHSRSDT